MEILRVSAQVEASEVLAQMLVEPLVERLGPRSRKQIVNVLRTSRTKVVANLVNAMFGRLFIVGVGVLHCPEKVHVFLRKE